MGWDLDGGPGRKMGLLGAWCGPVRCPAAYQYGARIADKLDNAPSLADSSFLR